MKDWLGYIKEFTNSDLWGFILLDCYHRKKAQDYKEGPSSFIDSMLSELSKGAIDPVAFHNVLLSVCVHLLGNDFSEIMDKSIKFLKDIKKSISQDQLQVISLHYDVYGKREVFLEKLKFSGFNVIKNHRKNKKAKFKGYPLKRGKIQAPSHKEEFVPVVSLRVLKDFNQGLPNQILVDPFKNTHLLRYYSRDNELLKAKPFKNKQVFFVLHFLKDLIPFVQASIKLGLNIKSANFFYKDYPYPQREAIKKWLDTQGAIVKPSSSISTFLKQVTNMPQDSIGEILIIEDGGFFVPSIHKEFTQLAPNIIGGIEQTTRGIRNAENWEKEKRGNKLKFPLISVATSKLKKDFEPPYIARAAIDNIKRLLPNLALNGKAVGLFGCGNIGKEIAEWLRQNNANVTIFDPFSPNKLWAQQKGFTLGDSPDQTVRNKNFVIGASGEESINSEVIACLSHGTYLVSTSSELYEIDIGELNKQRRFTEILKNDNNEQIGTTFILPPNDRKIHVLANGYPINFWGIESMPEEASDLILSLIFLCAAEVALGNYPTPHINSDAVNEIAEKYKIADKFLEFHKQG